MDGCCDGCDDGSTVGREEGSNSSHTGSWFLMTITGVVLSSSHAVDTRNSKLRIKKVHDRRSFFSNRFPPPGYFSQVPSRFSKSFSCKRGEDISQIATQFINCWCIAVDNMTDHLASLFESGRVLNEQFVTEAMRKDYGWPQEGSISLDMWSSMTQKQQDKGMARLFNIMSKWKISMT